MTDLDIMNLYQKWIELDRELKELRNEVNQMKWYAQHGTNGAVAYSATEPKKSWPQLEEDLYEDDTK